MLLREKALARRGAATRAKSWAERCQPVREKGWRSEAGDGVGKACEACEGSTSVDRRSERASKCRRLTYGWRGCTLTGGRQGRLRGLTVVNVVNHSFNFVAVLPLMLPGNPVMARACVLPALGARSPHCIYKQDGIGGVVHGRFMHAHYQPVELPVFFSRTCYPVALARGRSCQATGKGC